RHLLAGGAAVRAADRRHAVHEEGPGEGGHAGDAADDPRAGAVEAEHEAEHGGGPADPGREPGDGAGEADAAGARGVGLDREEGARQQGAGEAEAAQQQAARQGKVAGQVETVFAEVDRLEGEQKWPEALAAARRAEAAVAGGEADAETAERVRRRLKDLELIDRLEQIRMELANVPDSANRDQDYARAFRDYGVDVEKLAVDASVE